MTGALALLFSLAEVDAAHGRIEGDLAVAVAAGVTAGPRAPRATGDLRLRYLSSAGLFASYEEGGGSAAPRRVLATGVELRPLFLARWATGHELGSPRVDLFIDSLALEVGAAFLQPDGAGFRPALQAGLGLELPLFESARGLFFGVHAGGRWSDAALAGNAGGGPVDRAAFATFTLGWQELFSGPFGEAAR